MKGLINGQIVDLSEEEIKVLTENIVSSPITTNERLAALEQAITDLAIQTMGVNIDE